MIIATSAPNVLPVSLAGAIRHLRILTEDADMAAFYLQAATEMVEDYTGRALVTKTYRLTLADWPVARCGAKRLLLELRRSPLASVQSVQYYPDGADVLSALDAGYYRVLTSQTPGALEFVDMGETLPALADRADAVQVNFTAGYGVQEHTIPAMLRNAVLMLARHLYDNRGTMADVKMVPMPYSVKHILRSQRVESLAPLSA